jgi:hypothetical protein
MKFKLDENLGARTQGVFLARVTTFIQCGKKG